MSSSDETGKISVAAVAKDMSRTFPSMKFALLVGIGGGIWSTKVDVRLGDVVVGVDGPSPGVIQYDYGRTIQGKGLVQRGSLQKPPAALLNAVAALKTRHRLGRYGFVNQLEELSKHESDYLSWIATRPDQDTDRLFQSDYVHAGGDTCSSCENGRTIDREVRKTHRPQVHHGLIASGDQVMKDAEMSVQIMLRHDVICFEMEAAGLMDTFHHWRFVVYLITQIVTKTTPGSLTQRLAFTRGAA
ncbi:hypothetical protein BDV97DRAFT_394105 [Delphinella strobiligena]|nr:hypothetical protein BDV97DRAFT_394105 [Delphinella strobiligena]